MRKNIKSQASLEFLTTYAWAFLVIMITIGALYYFGVFDFSKILPQRCFFSSQFECLDFVILENEVRVKLYNNIGEDIRIKNFQITNDASNPLDCETLQLPGPLEYSIPDLPGLLDYEWGYGTDLNVSFKDCSEGGLSIGERIEAKISMVFCSSATPSCPEHTTSGKMASIVN